MLIKIKYVNSIKEKNIKLLKKYKKISNDLLILEKALKYKTENQNNYIENIGKMYIDSIEYYQNICKNLE